MEAGGVDMAVLERAGTAGLLADREALREIVDRVYEELGILHDPMATAEQSRALIRAEGVRPEDNSFSREIIQMGYPDDEDTD
jgi:hypothetical protein